MGVKILGKVCGVLLLVMCGSTLFSVSAKRSVTNIEQVLERSVYNNNIRLHDLRKLLEMRGLIRPLVKEEDEVIESVVNKPLHRRSRQKRDAKGRDAKGEKKKTGVHGVVGGIWKRISRGIEKFKKHIRQTQKKLIRIINGPDYSKSKGQGVQGLSKLKGKAASSSSKTKATSRESYSDEDTR